MINLSNLQKNIYSNDKRDWVEAFESISILAGNILYMLRHSDDFTENEQYNMLETFRGVCKTFNDDARSTGTIIKQVLE